jgi:hypothetical protein
MALRRVLVAFSLAALAGCPAAAGGPPPADPADAVQAWKRALEKDDPKAAYALLSPRVQKDLPYAEFEKQWKETAAERQRQAAAMGKETGPLEASAVVALDDGKKARLLREKARWRLEAPLISSSRADTPQEAARLFAAALEDRSFPAVMKLLTPTRRDGIDAQIDAFVAGLRANVGREVTITGDVAIIEWREGSRVYKITLKRDEKGDWRVDDVSF